MTTAMCLITTPQNVQTISFIQSASGIYDTDVGDLADVPDGKVRVCLACVDGIRNLIALRYSHSHRFCLPPFNFVSKVLWQERTNCNEIITEIFCRYHACSS